MVSKFQKLRPRWRLKVNKPQKETQEEHMIRKTCKVQVKYKTLVNSVLVLHQKTLNQSIKQSSARKRKQKLLKLKPSKITLHLKELNKILVLKILQRQPGTRTNLPSDLSRKSNMHLLNSSKLRREQSSNSQLEIIDKSSRILVSKSESTLSNAMQLSIRLIE